MISRPIAGSEEWYILAKCNMQMAVKVTESARDEIIDRIHNRVLATQLSSVGKQLINQKKPLNIIKLPENIKSCADAVDHSIKFYNPKPSECLASIAASKDIIVVNMPHFCGDGGYIKKVIEGLCLENEDTNFHPFPTPMENFFEERIVSAPSACERVFNDPDVLRIQKCTTNKTPIRDLPIRIKRTVIDLDRIKDLRGSKITDSLWLGLTISSMAFDDKISKAGCSTLLDLRRYLKPEENSYDVCNCIAAITATSEAREKMTIGELSRRMRDDFNSKLNRGMAFSNLKANRENKPLVGLTGLGNELSNIGRIKLSKPIKDAYVAASLTADWAEEMLSTLSFHIDADSGNTLWVQTRTSPNRCTEKEHEALARSIGYVMKFIHPDMPLRMAVDEAAAYQRRF